MSDPTARHVDGARIRTGQGVLALAFVGALVAAGLLADRVGTAAPAPASAPTISSATWVCPHGGDEAWTGSVVVMNPGDVDVDVEITTLGGGRARPSSEVTVPAGHQIVHEVPASDPEATTVVDAFGGWVGVAWFVTSDEPSGLGAEPCAEGGARRWFAGDPATPQGDTATLVVANPFGIDAIVDAVLFTADRPPIRPDDWSDLEIGSGRSVALRVNQHAVGESALLVEITAQVGRVSVASFVTGSDGGIRSVTGATTFAGPAHELPVAGGAGPVTVSIGVPSATEVGLDVMELSREEPRPAANLTDLTQAGPNARPYPIPTRGVTSLQVRSDASGLVATLRAEGRAIDGAATGGTSSTASAWVIPSTLLGDPAVDEQRPGMVLVNPGSRDAAVTLSHLPEGEATPGRPTEVAVPAGAAVAVPVSFLEEAPDAAVLARAAGGGIVALGASTSLGIEGFARYALVLGVPLPD